MIKSEALQFLPLIKAWGEGKEIQSFSSQGFWYDLNRYDCTFMNPVETYRIKPKTNKYRVALFRGASEYPVLLTDLTTAIATEKGTQFIRWLTDWVEYEVSVV